MAGTLGEHGVISHSVHEFSDMVGVDELGVPEGHRGHAEVTLDGLLVPEHLMLELERVGQGCERVVVGLAEELHAAGLCQLTEAVDDLGSVPVELLEGGTGDGEGHPELTVALLDSLEKGLVHRKIAFLRNPLENGSVGKVVVIM